MKLFEGPEDALGVGCVESLVVVVEVNPASLAGHVGAPLIGELQNRGLAGVVELADAVLLDLETTRDAKLTLGFDLGWKAVSIPTETALHAVALHGLETRNHVFRVAGQQVAVVRQTVGEWRTIVEDELLSTRARCEAGLKGSIGRPKVEDALFDGWEAR